MSWDEAYADRYEEWSAHMTAGEPFADDSEEYVFVARKR
jgi:hypothetical protein